MPRLACWRPAVLRQALSGGELQPAVARVKPVHQGVRQVPGTRRKFGHWQRGGQHILGAMHARTEQWQAT